MSLESEIPKWPLRLTLSVLLLVEVFFLLMLFGEGGTEITLILSSIGILVLCVPTWRELPRARWILLAFLIWRILEIVIQASRNLSLSDHRLPGTLMLLAIYVLAAMLIASPLGQPTRGSATP
jgi:hypothetical protein